MFGNEREIATFDEVDCDFQDGDLGEFISGKTS
jgi:hypothetical protein